MSVFLFVLILILGIVGSLIEAGVLMLIWNYVIVALFAAPVVTYWQTLAIMAFFNIITAGLRVNVNNSVTHH